MDFGIRIERIFREPHMVVFRGGLMLEYVANSLAKKKNIFADSEKFSRLLMVGIVAAFVMDNL